MWPVFARVQTLLKRLTSTRAANLDLLDDINSDTSNLNSRLTLSRASNLDSIDNILNDTSLLESRLTSYRAGKLDDIQDSAIESIQEFSEGINSGTPGTEININYVDRSKSIIQIVGVTADSGAAVGDAAVTAFFESSTSFTVYRDKYDASVYVDVNVIEFK